jgi:hypothetical protein
MPCSGESAATSSARPGFAHHAALRSLFLGSMASGRGLRREASSCTCAFDRGHTMESASNATMRRASRSSEFDGGKPTLHLASSRRLAIESTTAAAIGEASTIAAMPSMTINTATSFKPPAGGLTAAGLVGAAAVAPVPAGSQEGPGKTRRELIGKRRKGGHYHREALQAQGAVTRFAPLRRQPSAIDEAIDLSAVIETCGSASTFHADL